MHKGNENESTRLDLAGAVKFGRVDFAHDLAVFDHEFERKPLYVRFKSALPLINGLGWLLQLATAASAFYYIYNALRFNLSVGFATAATVLVLAAIEVFKRESVKGLCFSILRDASAAKAVTSGIVVVVIGAASIYTTVNGASEFVTDKTTTEINGRASVYDSITKVYDAKQTSLEQSINALKNDPKLVYKGSLSWQAQKQITALESRLNAVQTERANALQRAQSIDNDAVNSIKVDGGKSEAVTVGVFLGLELLIYVCVGFVMLFKAKARQQRALIADYYARYGGSDTSTPDTSTANPTAQPNTVQTNSANSTPNTSTAETSTAEKSTAETSTDTTPQPLGFMFNPNPNPKGLNGLRCLNCHDGLVNRQRKFCSTACKNAYNYKFNRPNNF